MYTIAMDENGTIYVATSRGWEQPNLVGGMMNHTPIVTTRPDWAVDCYDADAADLTPLATVEK